ncbi:hypothetical protein H712_03216 [Brucella ovis IntaBari-2009-88-4]|nr:hypothetical protein C010_03238 [Brucella ovis 80/125]ENR05121.1 hypothetical protein C961_02938 [Brucella ovis F8/05B]ENS96128.1 hypothetical protein C009_03086 [Brucella ovis 81/8]ENT74612.1 hypothetical protein H712_03216 [Brucella ovis IntaBari-2009-88-4]ENT76777.1 hypothetical protein H720_03004 [Brucella ovis IntaBari-2006-46-348]ENT80553.1 hypothetical protein H713_03223 [Brucella ovis IntaBari-2010-47-268]ENT91532.1 hypothetical protein H715_03224 [Brucella ovis IntaBari-2002-82-58
MQFSMWTYPWDIQDLGLDMVCSDLREKVGGNTISLATSIMPGGFSSHAALSRRLIFRKTAPSITHRTRPYGKERRYARLLQRTASSAATCSSG